MATRRTFLKMAGMGAIMPLVQTAYASESNKGELPFELGMASYSLRNFDLGQALAITKQVGLTKISLKSMHLPLDSTPEQIAEAVTMVENQGIDLYGGGVIYMRKEAEVHQAFDYAKAAGFRVIIGVPNHEFLPLVNEKVQAYDIKVAIHNHGPGDKVYPTGASVYEHIKNLDKRIGLCLDIGHCVRIGEDPIQAAKQFRDRLHDVHIKDVTKADKSGSTLVMGQGVVDIPGFLKALLDIKYTGVASFEYEKDAKNPLPPIAQCVGYVRGVLDMLTWKRLMPRVSKPS
ncbi:sugar phosphate isomerase/epimerase family protein [Planctomycetota bacterium]